MDKKRCVAYVRVSTDSEAQTHSFNYQKEYWENEISQKPDQEFVGIYADKGISGRSMQKRPKFMEMIRDAEHKQFDIIYTKSVARFARNTNDLLKTVRLLREKGIEVIFEKEQIHSFNPEAELYLTIAAAVAENDLRIYSENQKWAIREKYKKGWIFTGCKILGYRMDPETNTLIVEPKEAETVQRIFELYLEGHGFYRTSQIMMQEKRVNVDGEIRWDRGAIQYILTNEKYKGCSLMQKYYNKDGICIRNKGDLQKFYQENTHQAIIPPDVFDKVQEIIKERASIKNYVAPPIYPFTGKIECGVCGKGYSHKFQNKGKEWECEVWICTEQNLKGVSACDNSRIKDTVLKEKFVEAYNEFIKQKVDSDEVYVYKTKQQEYIRQEHDLTALKVNHLIDINDYNQEVSVVREKIKELQQKIDELDLRGLTKKDFEPITEFDAEKVDKFIEKVTIKNYVVTFTFINGGKISKEYSNGKCGNKKGWSDRKNDKKELEELKCLMQQLKGN